MQFITIYFKVSTFLNLIFWYIFIIKARLNLDLCNILKNILSNKRKQQQRAIDKLISYKRKHY